MNVCRYFLSLSRKTLIVRKVWVSWLIFLLRRGVAHARPDVFEVPFEYLARRSIFPIMLPKYASSGRRRNSCRFRPLRCILAASKVTPWAPWGASRNKGCKPNSPPKSAPVVVRTKLHEQWQSVYEEGLNNKPHMFEPLIADAEKLRLGEWGLVMLILRTHLT